MKKLEKTITLAELQNKYFDPDRIHGYCKDCPNYEKLWSCPPFPFDIKVAFEGRNELKLYAWSLDVKGLSDKEIEEINLNTIYEMNYMMLDEESRTPGSFAFYAEPCVICGQNSCSRPLGQPCRHVDQMRYTLEAFGIDVSAMVKDVFDIDLKWAGPGKKYSDCIVRVSGLII